MPQIQLCIFILALKIFTFFFALIKSYEQIFQAAHILAARAAGVHFPRISIAISHADIFHRLSPASGSLQYCIDTIYKILGDISQVFLEFKYLEL